MKTDAIYSEIYKGHKIEIYPDLSSDSPKDWGDDSAFLVHYHRDCWIENDLISQDNLRAWYQGEKIEQSRDFHIFAVSAYIHSGVVLSLESTFPQDSGYGWDTSHVGAVLVSKKEAKTKAAARKIALGIVNVWNDNLSGNIYEYIIDGDGDSCGGFYGDYEKDSGALQAARESVDYLVKDNLAKHTKKLAAYIKNGVPLEKREACKI